MSTLREPRGRRATQSNTPLAARFRQSRELGSQVEVIGDAAGIHLVAALRKGLKDRPLALRAADRGLWTMPLSSCYLGKPSRHGLVLGFGGTSVPEIRAAIERLRRVVAA